MKRGLSFAGDMRAARWFPVDLDVHTSTFFFLAIEDGVVERSNFLDTRIETALANAVPVSAQDVPEPLPVGRLSWLFHTSFCGSTLAARALHYLPYNTCLREPLILRRLGDARFGGTPAELMLPITTRLLARPWHPGGGVVVKPTHAALNLASTLLDITPGSRAIILTSSLSDFLISNLKKPLESRARIPELAQRALSVGEFISRLDERALMPPDFLCAAALQWAAQRELLTYIANERVRVIDMSWLLKDFVDAMKQCARWFQLEVPEDAFAVHCEKIVARNAKDPGVAYGAERRKAEAQLVRTHFARELSRAHSWADRWLLPVMSESAKRDPTRWSIA
jgi:hypothetical protein